MQKAQDLEINTFNTAVGVVGVDRDFKVLSYGNFLNNTILN